jgi:rhodanese-related sulfurtransferase
VIVVCDNGVASGRCSDGLRSAGFESAYSLRGGLAAWQQENLPVVTADKG